MRLKVIIPNAGMKQETLREREKMLSKYAMETTEISVDCIDEGPESIESSYDELLASRPLLDKVIQAEIDGFDAVVVYCGSDPGVEAAREMVDIPVLGPGKVSFLIANDLAYRFSILTVLDETVARDTEHYRKLGFDITRLASVRCIGIPVADIREDMEKTLDALERVGKICVEEDGAHALVLSCLGMAGMGNQLQKRLGIPVIDPAFLVIKYAELLVGLELNYSRKSYVKYFK